MQKKLPENFNFFTKFILLQCSVTSRADECFYLIHDMASTGLSNDVLIGLYADKEKYVSVAFSYLQDMEKAKDVFSDAFAYVYERKGTLDGDLPGMKAYLMQTLKHRCLNEIRRDTVRQTTFRNLYDTDIDMLSDDNISRRILEKDIYAILADAGLKMEKLTYDIYVSSRIGGLSHKEIAKLYGLTTGRVAKEIMKATGIMDFVLKKYFLILMLLAMLYNR